jgi:hypothetical protein
VPEISKTGALPPLDGRRDSFVTFLEITVHSNVVL